MKLAAPDTHEPTWNGRAVYMLGIVTWTVKFIAPFSILTPSELLERVYIAVLAWRSIRRLDVTYRTYRGFRSGLWQQFYEGSELILLIIVSL